MTAMRRARSTWSCSSRPRSIPMRSGALRRSRVMGLSVHPKLAGLLIGGNAGPFRYTKAEWERLIDFAREVSKAWGTRWLDLHLAADAAAGRRQCRRAGQGRKRRRPLHRLPHCRPGHFAADLRRCRGDRLHRGFEHHGLGSRVGAAARGRRGPGRTPLHRRGVRLSRLSDAQQLVPGAAHRCAHHRRASPATLAEIEPMQENPLDALAAKLKERLPALF